MNEVCEDRRLPCLLGCPDGQDCMKHYQSCQALRALVFDSLGYGDDWENFDDLGIAAPSILGLHAWSCAFYAYHSVKFRLDEFVSSVGQSAPDHSTFVVEASIS